MNTLTDPSSFEQSETCRCTCLANPSSPINFSCFPHSVDRERRPSKVSKIATMFQCSSSTEESKEEKENAGPQVTVVRTESHVARFHNARALFEKMSDNKGEIKCPKSPLSTKKLPGVHTNERIYRSSAYDGYRKSRSPSPSNVKSSSNGYHGQTGIATVSSPYTKNSQILSKVSLKPSNTGPLNKGRPTSTVANDFLKAKLDHEVKLKNESNVKLNSEKHNEEIKNRRESRTTLNDKTNSIIQTEKKENIVPRVTDASLKPQKPAKPDLITERCLSSHLQNQQIIQRHKNWFQSFSKSKSPTSSPSKPYQSLSPSSSTTVTPEPRSPRDLDKCSSYDSLFSKDQSPANDRDSAIRRKLLKDTDASEAADWRAERAAILLGRNKSQSVEDATKTSDANKAKSFEDFSTLPSCWSPPPEYGRPSTVSSKGPNTSGQSPKPVTNVTEESSFSRASKDRYNRNSWHQERSKSTDACEDRDTSGYSRGVDRSSWYGMRADFMRDARSSLKFEPESNRRSDSGSNPDRSFTEDESVSRRAKEEEEKRMEDELKRKEELRRKEELERIQREETERQRIEEERRIAEEERRRILEEERRRIAEEERRRIAEEELRLKKETEKKQREMERKRAEEEQMRRIEEEKKRREEERKKIEMERLKREEEEKKQIEEKRKRQIEEKNRLEAEKQRRLEEERRLMEKKLEEERIMEAKKLEERRRKEEQEREAERARLEEERKQRNIKEAEKARLEEERKQRSIKEAEKARLEEERKQRSIKEAEKARLEEERKRSIKEAEAKIRLEETISSQERKIQSELEFQKLENMKENIPRNRKNISDIQNCDEFDSLRNAEVSVDKLVYQNDQLNSNPVPQTQENQTTTPTDQTKCSRDEETSRAELEKKWQMKRKQLEEEDRQRRERDRFEIEKTKKRIAELKKERDEMQRQQAIRLKNMIHPDADPEKSQDQTTNEPNEPNHSEPKIELNISSTKEPSKVNNSLETSSVSPDQNKPKVEESDQPPALPARGRNSASHKGTFDPPEPDNTEEIYYDHTVQSAQYKFQFCSGNYEADRNGYPENMGRPEVKSRSSYSSVSSGFEPLPPPIPRHNVDPAVLLNSMSEIESRPQGTEPVAYTAENPSSNNNQQERETALIEGDGGNLALLSEVCDSVPTLPLGSDKGAPPPGEDPDKDYDSVCGMDSPPPEVTEEGTTGSPVFFHNEMTEDGLVVRIKEILIEDGVHYFEDGHFWVEVPGLPETDEMDDLPSDVDVHAPTRIKFSQAPIQLFSTFSVSDYDRKNEDVDPVAASAEYELEKRVEKMDVFPVQIKKGKGGLGLSIIGMGVGADAGVEKLGIFVKTITPGGATERDGRIQVNDQIIEVDEHSLVGVTQLFAASVLKNTTGVVSFLIGRERDPDNSEVAMLIRQSLMADNEREERRKVMENNSYDMANSAILDNSFSSKSDEGSPPQDELKNYPSFEEIREVRPTYPTKNGQDFADPFGSSPHSIGEPREDMASAPMEAFNPNVDTKNMINSNEMVIMSQHLQEARHRNEMYEEEISLLRSKIDELENQIGGLKPLKENQEYMKDFEGKLQAKQTEIATYQDMLEQSQGQYIVLEKKYCKAKKIIKEYQNRERDFLHREEYHISQLEEKDTLYNSLVKALKDRIIQLEGDLARAQEEAGIPVKVSSPPSVSSSFEGEIVNSLSSYQQHKELPKKPHSLEDLENDLSDSELPEGFSPCGSKSSTVERKVQPKEDLDVAVPPTELLDNSFSKAKGELASRGGLAKRQLPTLKKTASSSSCDQIGEDSHGEFSPLHRSAVSANSSPSRTAFSDSSQQRNSFGSASRPPPPYQPHQTSVYQQPPPPYQPPPSAPLNPRPTSSSDLPGNRESTHRHQPPIARVQPVNRVDVGHQPTGTQEQEHQRNLAEQLKSLLAERENSASSSRGERNDLMKKSPSSLMEDVRQAVMQADTSLGKKPVISGPIHVSSTAQVVSTGNFVQGKSGSQRSGSLSLNSLQQRYTGESEVWSGTVGGVSPESSPGGVVLLSQRPLDASQPGRDQSSAMGSKSTIGSFDSNSSFGSNGFNERQGSMKSPKEIISVFDWTKEQVAQWLVVQGLEGYVSTFVSAGITGPRLINIDSKDLRSLGLSSDDKARIKRKIKDLRQTVEKERKQMEKENKEREKLQKKAEKLAEKAEKKKK